MMEAVRTSETSVDNHFTRQYIPEDNSEHHTRRRENFKSHTVNKVCKKVGSTVFAVYLPASDTRSTSRTSQRNTTQHNIHLQQWTRITSMWDWDKWYFYVVKNAIQHTSVWFNGDLCCSWVIVQTKIRVSENISWFLTCNVCFYLWGLSLNVESL
jgi:hypothetical protein